jgi:5S rRNA maturation endonuclease (ribonuclease M5)
MTQYLTESNLFWKMIKYDKSGDVKNEFYNKIIDLGFNDYNEINIFLHNYKNLDYNKNNLNKYINLLIFFDYNISENFIRHIFEKYFYEIINTHIDDNIIEMIKIITSVLKFKYIFEKYYDKINKKYI